MKNIKDLLLKYSSFGLKEKELKEKVLKVFDSFNIKIEKNDFEIKNKTIFLKICGPRKTETFLNKSKILKELEGEILEIS